jgi:uncharacterized protein YjbI with pentapeptide repeats
MVPQAPTELALPALTPHSGEPLATHGDYDAASFTDLDLSEQNANNTRLLDCAFLRCRADGLQLRRARFVETLVADLQATTIDLTESVWRDSLVTGGRIGAIAGSSTKLSRVRFRGVKLDFLNLRGATLQDVVFQDCVLGEVDAGDATLTDVDFSGSRLDSFGVRNAALTRVDLSRATLQTLSGLEHLRGAIVSAAQLLDLAPLFADHLGIVVSDPAD